MNNREKAKRGYMSYCRFSDDNWKSDVYVYEHCDGGYRIHVASRKLITELPKLPGLEEENIEEWVKAHNEQMDILETASYENIGLEHDGLSFSEETLQALYDRLANLKEIGYNVPGYVFDIIKKEMNQVTNGEE